MNKFLGLNLDFAGTLTAAICAVHCTVFPLFFSLGFTSTAHHSHTFDYWMMFIGVAIAGYVLVRDLVQVHRSYFPILIAIIGFILLFSGIESHGGLFFLNILGGCMIILSHLMNWKISHSLSHSIVEKA